jgi:AcrR family transcriptional regulator
MAAQTRDRLVEAARECLLADGHANLSTRRVADRAGVPLSQIHYHFGGRQGLVLALLAHQNEQLLERQQAMYGAEVPLWLRYEQACGFLRDDLESGYVRLLQEMIAAGWTDRAIGVEVTRLLRGWFDLLEQVVEEAADELGDLGPFSPRSIATLVGLSFMGGESMLLLEASWADDVFDALEAAGTLLKLAAGVACGLPGPALGLPGPALGLPGPALGWPGARVGSTTRPCRPGRRTPGASPGRRAAGRAVPT